MEYKAFLVTSFLITRFPKLQDHLVIEENKFVCVILQKSNFQKLDTGRVKKTELLVPLLVGLKVDFGVYAIMVVFFGIYAIVVVLSWWPGW